MIAKTGIDIVYIPRFREKLAEPGFMKRSFTDREIGSQDPDHLAGLFALKEAFFKAAQPGIRRWTDIEICGQGKPKICFLDRETEKKIESIDCSIAHDRDYAVASVFLLER